MSELTDKMALEMDALLERLSFIQPPRASKVTFKMRLPSEEWESFAQSENLCRWRSLPCDKGRKVELEANGPYNFGRHSHAISEVFTVHSGACLFGVGDLGEVPYLTAGKTVELQPHAIHSLRVLEAGRAVVSWPDLEDDYIELTAE